MADFHEDRETPLCRRRSGRRAYLQAAPVVAAIVAVAIVGAAGSRFAPADGSSPSPSGRLAAVPSSPSPAGPALWAQTPEPSHLEIAGLAYVSVDVRNTVTTDLPPDTLPLAADGGDFLYSSGRGLFVLTPGQPPLRFGAARPCGQIEMAALSGLEVIYSEIVPAGYSGDGSTGCPDFGDAVDWYVSIANFAGWVHQVASGTSAVPPSGGTASGVPSVAITDVTYGLSRPDKKGNSAVVELHLREDDSLIYRSDPMLLPVQIHRGGSQLVAVSSGLASNGDPAAVPSVFTSIDESPLQFVGRTSGAVALSHDGRRLVFAGCDGDQSCKTLETIEGQVRSSRNLSAPATVVSTDSGPDSHFEATAWISISPDGTPYIGIESPLRKDGIALTRLAQPMWVDIESDALVWLSLTPDGKAHLSQMSLATAFKVA